MKFLSKDTIFTIIITIVFVLLNILSVWFIFARIGAIILNISISIVFIIVWWDISINGLKKQNKLNKEKGE